MAHTNQKIRIACSIGRKACAIVQVIIFTVVDATRQVAQVCPRQPGTKPLGEFTITGRGSLPLSPLDMLPGTSNNLTLATLETSANVSNNSHNQQPQNTPNTIIEAQGWIKGTDGSITLVDQAPNVTPTSHSVAFSCPVLNKKGV